MKSRLTLLLVAIAIAAGGVWTRAQMRPVATGTGFLAGQVVETPSGRPVADATVTLNIAATSMTGTMMLNGVSRQPVVTDAQGRFYFAALPPGLYSPRVSKAGYASVAAASSRVTELADGDRVTDVRVRLAKLAVVSGVLHDDGGDPIVGTDVIAFRRTLLNGRTVIRPAGQVRTDDRGAYRIQNVQPGDYFICACGHDVIPFDALLLTTLAADPLQLMGVASRAVSAGSDVAAIDSTLRTFAPSFYPGSATIARATGVAIGSGEDKTGVDFTLAATKWTRVSGTIIGAVSPVNASSVRLVPADESEDATAVTQIPPMLVQPDGHFDFTGVPPGSYTLRVNHTVTTARGGGAPSGAALAFLGARGQQMGPAGVNQTPNDYPLWASEPITVGDDGVTGLSITLRTGVTVKGRVQFIGTSTQPTIQQTANLAVLLSPMIPDPGQPGTGAIARVNADGSFQSNGAVPGRYLLNSTLIQKWTTLRSITIGGVDLTDMPIEIGSSDISDALMTFTDTPLGTLAGSLSGGKPPSEDDLSVLIFPTDRKFWADPLAARRRFVNAPIGRTGTFTPLPLPAGEYFLVAVTDDAAVEWQEASKLDTLSKGAQRIQIADGDKKTTEVKR